jgi:two-component system, sporulation sensor kinase E
VDLFVDVSKIDRVFINVIKNSFDAMPNGGQLTIDGKVADGTMVFAFNDTGVGMSEETLSKLWTPLFTTKAKGMGFGSAICKRYVEAHGGKIMAQSTLGKGTTISVNLPLQKPAIQPQLK